MQSKIEEFVLFISFRFVPVIGLTPSGKGFNGSFSWNGCDAPSNSSNLPIGVFSLKVFVFLSRAAAFDFPQESSLCTFEVDKNRNEEGAALKLELELFENWTN